MPHLLHIDSSARYRCSRSRHVSAAFAEVWRAEHPDAAYTYRDLAKTPPPPVDEAHIQVMHGADGLTAGQAASWAVTQELVGELLAADIVLIGSPMYNFSVPPTLKAWLDRIAIPQLLADRQTGEGPLTGTRFIVVTARGGAYGPGTPRQKYDFQEPYLRAFFEQLGVSDGLTFVHTELTKAYEEPHLARFRDTADASYVAARAAARELAATTTAPQAASRSN